MLCVCLCTDLSVAEVRCGHIAGEQRVVCLCVCLCTDLCVCVSVCVYRSLYVCVQICLSLRDGVGISLVNSVPEELVYVALRNIQVEIASRHAQVTIDVSVADVKVGAVLKLALLHAQDAFASCLCLLNSQETSGRRYQFFFNFVKICTDFCIAWARQAGRKGRGEFRRC